MFQFPKSKKALTCLKGKEKDLMEVLSDTIFCILMIFLSEYCNEFLMDPGRNLDLISFYLLVLPVSLAAPLF